MPQTLHNLRWQGAGYDLAAQVPGRLLTTLLGEGIAADPAKGFMSRANEWIALRPWTLRGEAEIDALTCERLFLCATGVTGGGVVRVNGKAVSSFHSGDLLLEITGQAMGEKSVTVELVFAAGRPEGHPPSARIGIDGALTLRGISQLLIDEYCIVPRMIDGYGMLDARPAVTPYVPGRYVFRYAAAMGGETLVTEEFSEKLNAAHTALSHRIIVPVPQRWQPGVDNEPVIVRLTVLRAGLVCDDRLLTTGFRDASFEDTPQRRFSIDGARMFIAGVAWDGRDTGPVPMETAKARLSRLSRAHVNCLRVYGPEADAFLDLLDVKGFLLWQVLPNDPAVAADIIRRVRHRPSLIAYSMERPHGGESRAAVEALEKLVAALDGAHPFFGPLPGPSDGANGFESLFPVQYPGPERLAAAMNRDEAPVRTVACPAPALDPAALAAGAPHWPPDTALWAHRTLDPERMAALTEWFDETPQPQALSIRLARALQAETVRYAAERTRMRAADACGIFFGNAYDGVPSLFSPALFDGERPRPAYWALESALRPVHACAKLDRMAYFCDNRFTAHLCLLVNGPVMGPLTVRARLYLPSGGLLAETACDAAPETAQLETIDAILPDHPCVLVLRVTVERFGELLDVNDYMICVALHAPLWPMANAPFAAVRVRGGEIVNDCGHAALGVACGGFRDGRYPGWGALLPGERRFVRRENPVEGLNLEPVE